MPVVGYLIDCAHSQHKHLPRHMAEKLAVELNPIGHAQKHHGYHPSQSNGTFGTHLLNLANQRQICAEGDDIYDTDNRDDSDISDDDNQSNPSSSCCVL